MSLFEALGEWMSYPVYYASGGGAAPARTGASHAAIAPYGPFPAADGSVYLGVQNEREWRRFCEQVLGQPALASDPRFDSNSRRVEHRAALHAEIERVFGGLSSADVVARLDAAGIAYARMNSVSEFAAHPQLAARDRWRTIGSPAGPLPALRPPVTVEGEEPVMGPVPALGEHTDALLAEIGFDAATIAEWRTREGIVREDRRGIENRSIAEIGKRRETRGRGDASQESARGTSHAWHIAT